ncbi:MAG: YciI family protein [Acidobacteriia bacterium]|nr:YciI family protein [Terriglobia bacterium]
MRFLIMIKANQLSEAGVLPSPQYMAEMQKFNKALQEAGAWVSAEGLQPTSKGARVKFSKGKTVVVDGPFAETKEVVAGFWIWDVKSKQDAIDWVKRIPAPPPGEGTGESEIEIRQVYSTDDFPPELKAVREQFKR